MSKEHYLSLQPSEATVAHMASRIFSAYLVKGEVNDANTAEYIRRSTQIALDIANHADALCKSDGEWIPEKGAGTAGLL
jgi:intergrase/recombinase